MKAIIHAKAVLPGGVLENAVILTEGEKIRAVGTELPVPAGAEVIDALFSMTPYYWRTREQDRAKLKGLDRLQTVYDFDIFLYRKDGTV